MSAHWKPGDIAAVVRDGREVVAQRYWTGSEYGWRWLDAVGLATDWFDPDAGTKPRPLVVIDPEDREQVERLVAIACDSRGYTLSERFQAALRSLIAPPKPEEPKGLGAVVEDVAGELWTRANGAGEWFSSDGNEVHTAYAALDAVRVLSQGVDQ